MIVEYSYFVSPQAHQQLYCTKLVVVPWTSSYWLQCDSLWVVDSVKITVNVLEEGDFIEGGGVVSTGGGAFQLEDTTFCGGGVRFDLEEGI